MREKEKYYALDDTISFIGSQRKMTAAQRKKQQKETGEAIRKYKDEMQAAEAKKKSTK